MSDYPPEQQESEYLHTALLEYQRDVERLTIELTSAHARIAELEGEMNQWKVAYQQLQQRHAPSWGDSE